MGLRVWAWGLRVWSMGIEGGVHDIKDVGDGD